MSNHSLYTPDSLISRSGDLLAGWSGSAWDLSDNTQKFLAAFSEVRETLLRESLTRELMLSQRVRIFAVEDTRYVSSVSMLLHESRYRESPAMRQAIRLPPQLISIEAISYAGQWFDRVRDFSLEPGGVFFNFQVPNPVGERVTFHGCLFRGSEGSDFWADVINFHDRQLNSLSFYRAIHEASQTTYTQYTLSNAIAAAVGVEIVRKDSVVEEIRVDRDIPLVITQHETIRGLASDYPTVDIGDPVYRGDFVFDSVRFHDFLDPVPDWLDSLLIPPEYFAGSIQEAIRFQNAEFPTREAGELIGQFSPDLSLVHIFLPIEGSERDVEAFHRWVVSRERVMGYGIADAIAGRRVLSPTEVPENLNPLHVLWSIWLRAGMSVSVIRDPVSAAVASRLRAIRRIVPPWLSHLIQFTQAESRDELC